MRISGSNAGYTTFRGSVGVQATHSIRQFPLHFPSCASPCTIRFQTHSTIGRYCNFQLHGVTEDENMANCLLLFYEGQYLGINKCLPRSRLQRTCQVKWLQRPTTVKSKAQPERSAADIMLLHTARCQHSAGRLSLHAQYSGHDFPNRTTKHVTLRYNVRKSCGDMQFAFQMT